MKVKCTNNKCLHEWNYTGKITDEKGYITCPKCHYRIMLKKALGRIKDTHLSNHLGNSLTHSLTHSPKKPIKSPKIYIKSEKVIEEEHGEKEVGIKPCNKHNLPATYDSFEKKWLCKKCYNLEIGRNTNPEKFKQDQEVSEKEFTNLSDFNMDILEQEFKNKVESVASIREIPSETELIRVIPYDPIKHLEHMKNYA